MLDRASTFSDPQIVKLLKTKFIPVAIDQAYQRRQKDAEGRYYRKIAGQGPRNDFVNGTSQGLYVATADGRLLAYNNNRGPDRIRKILNKTLKEFKHVEAPKLKRGKPDTRFSPQPPKDGLIVRVTSKVLGGYEETDNKWKKLFQTAMGRDNLWIRKDEHQALVEGKFIDSLNSRFARFHLIDNTRGEPTMWRKDEVKKIDLKINNGKISGTAHLETKSGDRGYQAEVRGIIEIKNKKVVRLDLVVKGEFWGDGRYTRGAPKGKFPFAIAFTLADGKDIADKVPPQGSKGWVKGYIQ